MMAESKKKKRAKIAKKHANILMPKVSVNGGATNDDELENDVDNYEDSRIELRASGHNLVRIPNECNVNVTRAMFFNNFLVSLKLFDSYYRLIVHLWLRHLF